MSEIYYKFRTNAPNLNLKKSNEIKHLKDAFNARMRQCKVDIRLCLLCASGKSTVGCILLSNIHLKRVFYDLCIIKLKYDIQIIRCSTKTSLNPYPPWYFNTKTHQKQANSGSLRSHSTRIAKNHRNREVLTKK